MPNVIYIDTFKWFIISYCFVYYKNISVRSSFEPRFFLTRSSMQLKVRVVFKSLPETSVCVGVSKLNVKDRRKRLAVWLCQIGRYLWTGVSSAIIEAERVDEINRVLKTIQSFKLDISHRAQPETVSCTCYIHMLESLKMHVLKATVCYYRFLIVYIFLLTIPIRILNLERNHREKPARSRIAKVKVYKNCALERVGVSWI